MTISFTCPHCDHHTQIAEQYAGQSGPCASCGETITVPDLALNESKSPVGVTQKPAVSGGVSIVLVIVACSVMLLVCGGILVALLLPAVQSVGGRNQRMACANQMKQLALAFHNYHDTYGTFPPAYIPDEDGKPMTSWRVLILPFIEQQPIYDAYNFDEPWDSPNNLAVTNVSIPVYRCPNADTNSTDTNYMAIVGPNTVFPGGEATRMADIIDGMSLTLLLTEVHDSGVHWAEPLDIDASKLTMPPHYGATDKVSTQHPGGFYVAACDGAVHFVPDTVSPANFKAMITRGGGETVDLDF